MIEPVLGLFVTPSVRLVRALGEGGMGRVWLADHTALHTQVVVKLMAADLESSGDASARFAREAKAASQVKSPHVVQMLDYGVMEGGTPFIVMELLEGRDLASQLARSGPLAPREAAQILGQLARALVKAHERGIVHRDIKPSNIFLCDVGGGEIFVKLLDFGIAKSGEARLEGDTTRTGSVLGSPFYMSPEQVVGARDLDARSDLWSVGVVAFEMVTGSKPFVAETLGALALAIHNEPLPSALAKNPALPPAIDGFFARALARTRAERFQSARELAEAFALAATGERPPPILSVEPSPRSGDDLAAAVAPTLLATTTRDARARRLRIGLIAIGAGFVGTAALVSVAGRPSAVEPAAYVEAAAPRVEPVAPPPAPEPVVSSTPPPAASSAPPLPKPSRPPKTVPPKPKATPPPTPGSDDDIK